MPAASKMDPLLAKVKLMRNNSNTYVKMYLRCKKNLLNRCNCSQRREEATMQTLKISEKGGGGGAQMLKQSPYCGRPW